MLFRRHGRQGGPDHHGYVADIVHICSLLHALALQDLRRDGELENLVPAKHRLSRLSYKHAVSRLLDAFRCLKDMKIDNLYDYKGLDEDYIDH